VLEGDPAFLALVPIAFAGAIIYGLTGFGSALITIPLASFFVPLPFALAAFSLVDLASALRVGLERPRNAVRAEIRQLVPAILIGVAAGATLLVNLPRRAGMIALGVFVTTYAIYALAAPRGRRVVSSRWAPVAGFTGGVTGTVFGAGGPPYAIYLSHRGLTMDQFRATLGLTTLVSIGTRVAAFVATGLLRSVEIWLVGLAAIPAAMLGIALASRLHGRLSRDALARAVALVLLATGISLIVRAVR
jgi:hypothetical protein